MKSDKEVIPIIAYRDFIINRIGYFKASKMAEDGENIDVTQLLASINSNLAIDETANAAPQITMASHDQPTASTVTSTALSQHTSDMTAPKPSDSGDATEERKVEDKFVVVRSSPVQQTRKSDILDELGNLQKVPCDISEI